MSKKKHNPVQALKQTFQEAWDDNELDERYQNFKSHLKEAKEDYNGLVTQVNDNLDVISTLKESILSQALCGIISPTANSKIKELENKNEKLIEQLKFQQEIIDKNKNLIHKYQDWSERKLFIWWQAIKAVDPETKPWLEWKEDYNDKIF